MTDRKPDPKPDHDRPGKPEHPISERPDREPHPEHPIADNAPTTPTPKR